MSLRMNDDSEFRYADEIEPQVASIMEEVEKGNTVSGTTQTKEEVHRLFEMNKASRQENQFPNQDELKKSRVGRVLHMNEFLRLLRTAGLNAWYNDRSGMAGTTGLNIHHNGMYSELCKHEPREPHYIGFAQVPFMQEYEELYFDRYDVPLGSKRRGWRTLLLKVIENKFVTEQQADKIFGEPASGLVSRRYREYLSYIRHKEL